MSDEAVTLSSPAVLGVGGETAGRLLRQAREASGLHIAALAVAMKVPVKKLEALEADRLEELPDAVFVRALAASMCRTLKVDPAKVLALLPLSVAPRLDKSDSGVRMPAQGSGFLVGHSVASFVSRPAVLLVGALLLGALAVVLFPQARNSVGMPELALSSKAETQAAPAAPLDARPPAQAVSVEPAPMAAVTVVAPMAEPVTPAVSAAAPVMAPAPAKVASAPAKAVVATAAQAGAESGLLVFKARSAAWVRVSDSRGVVQFEKTLVAGESAAVSGVPPLAVVVGNVAATEVLLRGQPFQMQDLNQNNVARFEVK